MPSAREGNPAGGSTKPAQGPQVVPAVFDEQVYLQAESPSGWYPILAPNHTFVNVRGYPGKMQIAGRQLLANMMGRNAETEWGPRQALFCPFQRDLAQLLWQDGGGADPSESGPIRHSRVLGHCMPNNCLVAYDTASPPIKDAWVTFPVDHSNRGEGETKPSAGLTFDSVSLKLDGISTATVLLIGGEDDWPGAAHRSARRPPDASDLGLATFSHVVPGGLQFDTRIWQVVHVDYLVFLLQRLFNFYSRVRPTDLIRLAPGDEVEIFMPAIRLVAGFVPEIPAVSTSISDLPERSRWFHAIDLTLEVLMRNLLDTVMMKGGNERRREAGERARAAGRRPWRWVPLGKDKVIVQWQMVCLLGVFTPGLQEGSAILTYQAVSRDTRRYYGFDQGDHIPFGAALGTRIVLRPGRLPPAGVAAAITAAKAAFKREAEAGSRGPNEGHLFTWTEATVLSKNEVDQDSLPSPELPPAGMFNGEMTWLHLKVMRGLENESWRQFDGPRTLYLSIPVVLHEEVGTVAAAHDSHAERAERDRRYELRRPARQ